MHSYSYENEFNLHVNEISFSYEKMGTKTHFGEEAKGNSEMAYLLRQDVVDFRNRPLYGKVHPSSTICLSRISGDI